MIQFTLGCILLALTLFFGGKEILANQDKIANRTKSLKQEEDKAKRGSDLKQRYSFAENNAVVYSDKIKENILNQLNINEDKYELKFEQPEGKVGKVLASYTYTLEGYDSFSKVFSLVTDIEKVKGITVSNVCFNCEVSAENLRKRKDEIGFNVKGNVYVYSKEK